MLIQPWPGTDVGLRRLIRKYSSRIWINMGITPFKKEWSNLPENGRQGIVVPTILAHQISRLELRRSVEALRPSEHVPQGSFVFVFNLLVSAFTRSFSNVVMKNPKGLVSLALFCFQLFIWRYTYWWNFGFLGSRVISFDQYYCWWNFELFWSHTHLIWSSVPWQRNRMNALSNMFLSKHVKCALACTCDHIRSLQSNIFDDYMGTGRLIIRDVIFKLVIILTSLPNTHLTIENCSTYKSKKFNYLHFVCYVTTHPSLAVQLSLVLLCILLKFLSG